MLAEPNFEIVTPGVRPSWSDKGDQKRFTTPAEAVRMGAGVLVIGRPITKSVDPVDAIVRIRQEIAYKE